MRLNINRLIAEFLSGTEGSDLVEFSLLLAFICLAGAAAFMGIRTNSNVIWSAVNNRLATPVSGS
jgi:Flp pilus assembly pilin Flp